ncbi:aldo/keto reductase [Streptomyces noursei]|uniref:aldo/keto reductase n=1 Tax=Streptomyces noursei TaxID=1971 RepID=UPI0033FB7017
MIVSPATRSQQTRPVPVRRCGRSGLHLPAVSLALRRHNNAWGHADTLLRQAVEAGITHVEIASPSGEPAATEELRNALHPVRLRREELTVSLRVGIGTPGPLPGFGSRQRILSTLDAALHRTGLDFIDVLYAHRFDPTTPPDETVQALAWAVQQGKALYVGLSGFAPAMLRKFLPLMEAQGTPVVVVQVDYSLLDRWAEEGTFGLLEHYGVGCVATNPLAGGDLAITMPVGLDNLRAREALTSVRHQLTRAAAARQQTLPQMAVSWALKEPRITSVTVEATSPEELEEFCAASHTTHFDAEEKTVLNTICQRVDEAAW